MPTALPNTTFTPRCRRALTRSGLPNSRAKGKRFAFSQLSNCRDLTGVGGKTRSSPRSARQLDRRMGIGRCAVAELAVKQIEIAAALQHTEAILVGRGLSGSVEVLFSGVRPRRVAPFPPTALRRASR